MSEMKDVYATPAVQGPFSSSNIEDKATSIVGTARNSAVFCSLEHLPKQSLFLSRPVLTLQPPWEQ